MKEKVISAVSYLWILFFLPLILIPNSSFGRFHANQALINLLFAVAAAIVDLVLGWIPIIGTLISMILGLVGAILVIWGIATALTGQQKPYPFIGGFKFIK